MAPEDTRIETRGGTDEAANKEKIKVEMKPFQYLEDAEVWMDENAVGMICVLVQNPPPWGDVNGHPSKWELERPKEKD